MNYSDMFVYDETSPSCLRWKVSKGSAKAGDQIGYVKGDGYWYVKINGINKAAHRIVWAITNGDIPSDSVIDHKDTNRLNNKIDNLRLVNKYQNAQNHSRKPKNQYFGVKLTKDGYWEASLSIKGKRTYVKTCKCKEDAALERDLAAYRIYGEFGRYSFPDFVKSYCVQVDGLVEKFKK